MATENGVNNTSCTMHNVYFTKQLTQDFKTAYFPPCSIYSKAESSNNTGQHTKCIREQNS